MRGQRAARARVYTFLLVCACFLSCAPPLPSAHERRAPLVSVEASGTLVYVALGDSTGLGLGARDGGGYAGRLLEKLRQTHPRARLVNLCSASATSADVLANQVAQLPEAQTTQTTLVTLGVGVNDLLRGVSEEEFAGNYERIISRLQEARASPVVINLPDLTAAPGMLSFQLPDASLRITAFNKRIAEAAQRHGLPVFDLHQMSARAMRAHPEFFSEDGFHPSDAGYRFWAEAMWPTVERALARPAATRSAAP